MIKEFLVNLKRIEPNQTNPDDKEEDKQENNSNIHAKDHEDGQNVINTKGRIDSEESNTNFKNKIENTKYSQ